MDHQDLTTLSLDQPPKPNQNPPEALRLADSQISPPQGPAMLSETPKDHQYTPTPRQPDHCRLQTNQTSVKEMSTGTVFRDSLVTVLTPLIQQISISFFCPLCFIFLGVSVVSLIRESAGWPSVWVSYCDVAMQDDKNTE